MVKIQMMKKGQYFVTIPRKIVSVMGWEKGTVLDYEVLGRDTLKMFKVKEAKA